MNKKDLRKKMLSKRNDLSPENIYEKSGIILERFYQTSLYKDAKRIMTYVPFQRELRTDLLIQRSLADGKEIYIPVTVPKEKKLIPSKLIDLKKDLITGHFGVLEPKPSAFRPVAPQSIDLIIVPGLVFTREGYRIGYGGGYYDRFLANPKVEASKVSLVFDFQILSALPVDDYDLPVEWIFTETETIQCLKK